MYAAAAEHFILKPVYIGPVSFSTVQAFSPWQPDEEYTNIWKRECASWSKGRRFQISKKWFDAL